MMTDLTEKWKDVSFLIRKHKQKNTKEDIFHKEVENIFEKLGWSFSKGEIVPEENIKIGAANSLRPDIILKENGKSVLVIEIKHPNIKKAPVTQLQSYMRQLKLEIGVFISDRIEIYYDPITSDDNPAQCVFTISADDTEGEKIIELLSKETFDIQKIRDFCEEQLNQVVKENEVRNLIITLQNEDFFKTLLIEHLTKREFEEEIINSVIEDLIIKVSSIKTEQKELESRQLKKSWIDFDIDGSLKKPEVTFFPTDEKEFKAQLIKKGEAEVTLTYKDGTNETKNWNAGKISTNSNLRSNIWSGYLRDWQEKGIVKAVFKVAQ